MVKKLRTFYCYDNSPYCWYNVLSFLGQTLWESRDKVTICQSFIFDVRMNAFHVWNGADSRHIRHKHRNWSEKSWTIALCTQTCHLYWDRGDTTERIHLKFIDDAQNHHRVLPTNPIEGPVWHRTKISFKRGRIYWQYIDVCVASIALFVFTRHRLTALGNWVARLKLNSTSSNDYFWGNYENSICWGEISGISLCNVILIEVSRNLKLSCQNPTVFPHQ